MNSDHANTMVTSAARRKPWYTGPSAFPTRKLYGRVPASAGASRFRPLHSISRPAAAKRSDTSHSGCFSDSVVGGAVSRYTLTVSFSADHTACAPGSSLLTAPLRPRYTDCVKSSRSDTVSATSALAAASGTVDAHAVSAASAAAPSDLQNASMRACDASTCERSAASDVCATSATTSSWPATLNAITMSATMRMSSATSSSRYTARCSVTIGAVSLACCSSDSSLRSTLPRRESTSTCTHRRAHCGCCCCCR
eukprot:36393-Chlamydomonas_euryale.AAC.1